VRPQ